MEHFFTEKSVYLHNLPIQLKRQENLANVALSSIDNQNFSGILGSNDYATTLFNCTCKDFKTRQMPCKHMYRLALGLGVYKNNRAKREENLIADFSSGYAYGWSFAIPTCFRESLDIKLTPRSKKEKTSNGKYIKENIWTQGELYNFHEAAIIYSDKIAYETCWSDALKELRCFLQIENVTPSYNIPSISFENNVIVNKSAIHYGTVEFKLYKPQKNSTEISLVDIISCKQNKFLEFLQTGVLKTSKESIHILNI